MKFLYICIVITIFLGDHTNAWRRRRRYRPHHQKTVNCLRGAVGLRVIMNAVMLESKIEQDTRLNRNAVEEHVDHWKKPGRVIGLLVEMEERLCTVDVPAEEVIPVHAVRLVSLRCHTPTSLPSVPSLCLVDFSISKCYSWYCTEVSIAYCRCCKSKVSKRRLTDTKRTKQSEWFHMQIAIRCFYFF